jgi:Arc/MetJ family transcription regulator
LEFLTITDELDETGLDIAYGLATYDDYAYGSYGYASSGDKPFILRQQVTTDDLLVDDAIDAVELHYGGDAPESTMEALYQAMTGAGYDQNCNESYDSDTDVLPFLADTSDPFLGTGGESYVADTPDGGVIGGMGFREGSLPVIIYATDNYLRDSDADYGVPGGCHIDASGTDVVAAAEETGAVLIGIAAGASVPTAQMEELAVSTGSVADTDGDGVADDPLVFSWYSGWAAFASTVVGAVADLTASYEFAVVELVVEDDPDGVVSSITPASYADVAFDALDDLEFSLNLDVSGVPPGTLTVVTVGLYGDGTLIETQEVTIMVPPA